jgi:hypothetical protein
MLSLECSTTSVGTLTFSYLVQYILVYDYVTVYLNCLIFISQGICRLRPHF